MDARKRKGTSEKEERAGKSTFQNLHEILTNMLPDSMVAESQKEHKNVNYDKSVQVKAPQKAAIWQPLNENKIRNIDMRADSQSPRRVACHSSSFMKKLVPGEIIKCVILEVFDEYNNHVQENELISLQLDGLCVQDGRRLTFKANKDGYVDLSGILKVVKGFGQRGSFSVFSDDQKIFEKSFQTEGRELRTAFRTPFITTGGSLLKNIAFEVIKENGEVDEGIHCEGENGGSHTLTISSNSFEPDRSVKYNFIHGRCTVPKIPLCCNEGYFDIKAAHSHHPEINLNFELLRLKPERTGEILDKLTAEILQNGSCIRLLEDKIISLKHQQSILKESISSSQECLNPVVRNASKLVPVKEESVEKQLPISPPLAIHSPGESSFATQFCKKKELREVNIKLARLRAEREDVLSRFSKQERMFRSLVTYIDSLGEIDQTKGKYIIFIDEYNWFGTARLPTWYTRL